MFDLETLMNDLKLTQNDLAKELGVTQGAISKVKNGHMDIPEAWVDHLNAKYDLVITKYFVDSSMLKDPLETYEVQNKDKDLIKSLLNLTESNKSLAESVNEAIKLNAMLIKKMRMEMA